MAKELHNILALDADTTHLHQESKMLLQDWKAFREQQNVLLKQQQHIFRENQKYIERLYSFSQEVFVVLNEVQAKLAHLEDVLEEEEM